MKVLHVIPSVAIADGGPARAVVQMVRSLSGMGIEAHIATTDDAGNGHRLQGPHGTARMHEGCTTYFFPRQTRFYKVSLPLKSWLEKQVRGYDVVHTHALFSFAPWAAGKACWKQRVPYIVRPLGVLNHYGMTQRKRWLKSLSFNLLERKLITRAAAVHYTSSEEANEAARLRLGERAEVIPLGIDISRFANLPSASALPPSWPDSSGRRIVLFMSRIDAKKGLDVLLNAFAIVRKAQPDALLVICGSGDAALEARLREQAVSLGIQDDVKWMGFLDGKAKLAALAAASVYVLPSQSENFGIALLEAMAAGLPCVATPGVALAQDAPEAVRLAEYKPESVAQSISSLLASPSEAAALGSAARACAFAKFSSEATANNLAALYRDLANHR